jgi:hypothetical protein
MTPTSFHEVIATDSERTTTLRDIFLGTEVTIFERSDRPTSGRGNSCTDARWTSIALGC